MYVGGLCGCRCAYDWRLEEDVGYPAPQCFSFDIGFLRQAGGQQALAIQYPPSMLVSSFFMGDRT